MTMYPCDDWRDYLAWLVWRAAWVICIAIVVAVVVFAGWALWVLHRAEFRT